MAEENFSGDKGVTEREPKADMRAISFKRHQFPPDVIRYAVWLYFRFTLSLRDVEELLAQRGIDVSYETIRCWTIKFGPVIAANLRRRRCAPIGRWHLDEMVAKIGGRRKRWRKDGCAALPGTQCEDQLLKEGRREPRCVYRQGREDDRRCVPGEWAVPVDRGCGEAPGFRTDAPT